MFAFRDRWSRSRWTVDVAFTDRWGGVSTGPYAALDLTADRDGAAAELAENRARVVAALEVDGLALMRQVHGADVVRVTGPPAEPPVCDALVTSVPGVALCARAADCVPLLLADAEAGVVAAAHVGRPGITAGTVAAALRGLRDAGARDVRAWVGPHVCAGCYEVPADMRDEVTAVEPAAYSCTTWGTPSVDIGAAVVAQLRAGGCDRVTESPLCTRENEDLFSYRRQGSASGRGAGLVVLRDSTGVAA